MGWVDILDKKIASEAGNLDAFGYSYKKEVFVLVIKVYTFVLNDTLTTS